MLEITSSRRRLLCLVLSAFATLGSLLRGELTPNSLFADNAVLQRDTDMPVWGTATAGAKVSVTFDGQTTAATTHKDGKWMAHLKPHAAGGPFTMTITGEGTTRTINNILIGDVWVASGQSNMQDTVGPVWWAQNTKNWQEEVKNANYPDIRQYKVPNVLSYHPVTDEKGAWEVCSPETAGGFTAAGYYFARDLQQSIKVPIGIINSSWGGTVAEAWTSAGALKTMPDFSDKLKKVAATDADHYATTLEDWYKKLDPGSSAQPPWSDNATDTTAWKTMTLPTYWQDAGLAFNGICWFRKEIDLPADYSGTTATVHLEQIDDQDTTWLNGVRLGGMDNLGLHRDYPVPAGVLKPGKNFVTVRVLDLGGKGGLFGPGDKMRLELDPKSGVAPIPLAGEWQYRPTTALTDLVPRPPPNPQNDPNAVTVLWNGMMTGLLQFPIKGVIWYQGESNAGSLAQAKQYRTLFPLMIADWRKHWGEGNFPFLFVQIAPYKFMPPEIREAQMMTLAKSPNTAVAVITDAGDDNNIHPADKQMVGARLAIAARSLVYGEKIESMGPIYQGMEVQGNKAIIHFTHVTGGLMAKHGDLVNFTICGPDKNFVPAKAEIQGDTVVVTGDGVTKPVAVRYGWSNTPDSDNLFNHDDLPASPFRTDPD